MWYFSRTVGLRELAEVGALVELSGFGKFERMFSDVGELSEVAQPEQDSWSWKSNLADLINSCSGKWLI